MVELDGKNEGDFAVRRENESVPVWLARLVVRAQPSEAAFANLRDASRRKLTDNPLAAELAFMRAHQAAGQFRQCAHAALAFLSVTEAVETLKYE